MCDIALLLREGGGLGDILQVASLAPLIKEKGYSHVVLATLADPSILALSCLFSDIDFIVPIKLKISSRRPRCDSRYDMHPYLENICSLRDRVGAAIFDCWCPASVYEVNRARSGSITDKSRAQIFAEANGLNYRGICPPRIRHSFSNTNIRYDVLLHYKSRDLSRSLPVDVVKSLCKKMSKYASLAVYDSNIDLPSNIHICNIRNRMTSIYDLLKLIISSKVIVAVDSFILHFAASLGKTVIGLFGPTYGPAVAAHYSSVRCFNKGICGPCYYQSRLNFDVKRCRTYGCINLISLDQEKILEAILEEVKK